MTNSEATAGAVAFRDRKTGLVVFGILQILLGGFCVLVLPLMVLGSLLDKTSGTSLRMLVPGMLFYAFLAAWFITMGIGSILARRWARALSLTFAWLWLACGIVGLLFVLLLMPNMFAPTSQTGQMSPAAAATAKLVMIGIVTIIYVILPGMFLFFYQSRHVKATCEARDAQTRWTDQCPLPVLALSLTFGFWAGSMPFMGFYNWVIPFFGYILSGPVGAAVAVVLVLLMGYVSWGIWRLRMAAWWCAVLSSLGWMVSTILTFTRSNITKLYEMMDLPPQEIELAKQFDFLESPMMIWFFSISFVVVLLYLLYIRRYFTNPASPKAA